MDSKKLKLVNYNSIEDKERKGINSGGISAVISTQMFNNKSDKIWNYWSTQVGDMIQDDTCIFSSVLNGELQKVKIDLIMKLLIKYNNIKFISQFIILPNSKLIYIKVHKLEQINVLKKTLQKYEEANIIFMQKFEPNESVILTIDNFPPDIIATELKEVIEPFADIIEIVPKKIFLPGDIVIQTTPIMVAVKLKEGKVIDDIPKVFFHNDIKVFIKYKGKHKLCFRCLEKGHIIKDCKKFYCIHCKSLKDLQHACYNTYAGRLKINSDFFKGLFENDNDSSNEDISSANEEELVDKQQPVQAREDQLANISQKRSVQEDIGKIVVRAQAANVEVSHIVQGSKQEDMKNEKKGVKGKRQRNASSESTGE